MLSENEKKMRKVKIGFYVAAGLTVLAPIATGVMKGVARANNTDLSSLIVMGEHVSIVSNWAGLIGGGMTGMAAYGATRGPSADGEKRSTKYLFGAAGACLGVGAVKGAEYLAEMITSYALK
jgi:hypothetical protein